MRIRKIFTYSKTTTAVLFVLVGTLSLLAAGSFTTHTTATSAKDAGGTFTSIIHKLPSRLSVLNLFDGPTVMTDKADYPIGATVVITGSGWQPGETVTLQVTDDLSATDPNHEAHAPWDVIADANGNISSTWTVDADADALTLTLTATGTVSGSTSTTFTDANPSANLDQCANDPAPSPNSNGCNSSASQWVNGNLGASKSLYLEGDSIPYRLVFGNLPLSSHQVTIEWDTTKSSKHAIDYLTNFNQSVLDANPCLGVSGCNPGSPSTFGIPADPQVTAAGVAQIAGNFRMYGGTITGVSTYSYPDGTGFVGDTSARITITFTPSVANPVLAWGGHIAQRRAGGGSGGWGDNNAAISISGSPYHTRLIDLDGSGGNQDRSLSADAVVFPGSITIIKSANPKGQDSFPFTASPSPLSGFSLVDDGVIPADGLNTKVFNNITNFTTYNVAETVPSGWTLETIQCSVTSANGGSQSISNPSVAIDLAEGENVTCTFSNAGDSVTKGKIKIVKVTVPAGSSETFSFSPNYEAGFSLTGVSAGGANQNTSAALKPTADGGSYSITENSKTGWTSDGGQCDRGTSSDIIVVAGQTTTCTFTNTRDQGYFKIKKVFDAKTSGFADNFTIHYDCGGTNTGDVQLKAGITSSAIGPFDTGIQCNVTEPNLPTAPTGWTFGTPSVDISPVTIIKNTAATTATLSTVTNSITRDQGYFKIKKIFDPLTSGFGGNFTVHYDCGGANSGNVDLAAGATSSAIGPFDTGTSCAVSEPTLPTAPTGWTFGTPSIDGSPVTIVKDTAATTTSLATVTNSISRDLGSLQINKVFDPLTSGFAGTFSINYDCNDGTSHDGTVTLAAGGSQTIGGIPTGTTCVVSEPSTPTPPTGWTFGAPTLSDSQAPTNDGTVVITTKGATYAVTVTNSISRDLGSLKINKVFDPLTSGFAGTFSINYDCNDGTSHDGTVTLAAGGSQTIGGIPTGTTCTVSEPTLPAAPMGWTFGTPSLSDSQAPTNDGTVVITTKAATYEVTVTNSITRDQGYLKIAKSFDSKTSGFNGTFDIVYNCGAGNNTVSLAAGGSTTVGPFDTGTSCTVSEPNLPSAPSGWTFGTPSVSGSPATITKGDQASAVVVTVTNSITRDQGYFKIKKIFDPLTSGFVSSFTIHYNCGAGDHTVSLTAGATSSAIGPFDTGTSCAVSEPTLPTAPTGWTFGTPSIDGSPVTIVKDTAATTTSLATVTNSISRDLGSIKIVKIAVGGDDTFSYTSNFGVSSITTSSGGGDQTVTGLGTGSGYSISEANKDGWDKGIFSCDRGTAAAIMVVKDMTTTCTITNTKRGLAKVVKTLNNLPLSGTDSFTFQLRSGASDSAAGTIVETGTANAANSGVINFSTTLVPGQTYQLCEQMQPGWLTTLGPPLYSVFNPSGDNSVVCTDFTVSAGETKEFDINNQPPPGGMGLTIGFWKNWASCAKSNGGQKPTTDRTLQLGDIVLGSLTLHDSISNPDVASDCQAVVNLLNKTTISGGKKMASDPIFNMVAQLVAADLNVLAGAGQSVNAMAARNCAHALLAAIHFDGTKYDKLTAAQTAQANCLATALDQYNNNKPVQACSGC